MFYLIRCVDDRHFSYDEEFKKERLISAGALERCQKHSKGNRHIKLRSVVSRSESWFARCVKKCWYAESHISAELDLQFISLRLVCFDRLLGSLFLLQIFQF